MLPSRADVPSGAVESDPWSIWPTSYSHSRDFLQSFLDLSSIFPSYFVTTSLPSPNVASYRQEEKLKKYRRIEVNAFHRRRVTIVSGECPRNAFEPFPGQINDEILLKDSEASEPVEADSVEGQLVLLEAVRCLEQRLSPETRATIRKASTDFDAEAEESQ